MTDPARKIDPFKPVMPRIPGVSDRAGREGLRDLLRRLKIPKRLAIPLGVALVSGAIIGWWVLRSPRPAASEPPEAAASASASPASPTSASPRPPAPSGPGPVATLDELAKPWDAKRFVFVKPLSRESVPALVLRLPGGSASESESYWAFALRAPYGQCDLVYVTDLGELSRQYGFRANHPMVADPCTSTVYDPLRIGTVPGGAWARGEIVQGASLRPPIAIEVRIQGQHVVAERIE